MWPLQIIQNCPKDFLEVEDFACLASELCLTSLFKFLLRYHFTVLCVFQVSRVTYAYNNRCSFRFSCNVDSQCLSNWEKTIFVSFKAATTLLGRFEPQVDNFLYGDDLCQPIAESSRVARKKSQVP